MKKHILFILLLSVLTSCGTYKRLAYLQDTKPMEPFDVAKRPEAHIAKGDKLKITVSSSQPELAAPFNASAATSAEAVAAAVINTGGLSIDEGYEVDQNGFIQFPVLGKFKVGGMTLTELSKTITEKIQKTGYIKDPIVKCEFTNFQITVLGEFGKPGNYNIPTGTVSIFEMLAMVGDMTEDAQRSKLWVVRTKGDSKQVFEINPKSKNVYNSPAFYLQQNDMLYVSPRDGKLDKTTSDTLQKIMTPVTILSTLFTGLTLLITLKRGW